MPEFSADEQFMQYALELARQGVGLASPNPCVGAVVVDGDGNVVGTGTHAYDGIKHAEVLALEQAGAKARGSTLYISLEPCSHGGRTPPCADALIAAGIRRVVASIADPNPAVAGRGFEKLRAAGVLVETGMMAEQARRLNEGFARHIRKGIPFVTLKSAMTLDGKIAPRAGACPQEENASNSRWITGEAARVHAQELRHEHDALLVGVGTILADDPLLTDRSGLGRRRPLLRVVLDSHLRIPLHSRLVQGGGNGDVLIFCLREADKEKKSRLIEHGVGVETLPASQGTIDLEAVLRRLGQMVITSLMIEGGSVVNAAALAAGIVDKVFFYFAPTIFAGNSAVPFAAETAMKCPNQAVRINSTRIHRFGDDFAVEGYIRDPYQD